MEGCASKVADSHTRGVPRHVNYVCTDPYTCKYFPLVFIGEKLDGIDQDRMSLHMTLGMALRYLSLTYFPLAFTRRRLGS